MTENNRGEIINKIKGKKVLYIATKNSDYLRLQQEIRLIQNYAAESDIIVSQEKSYIKRIIYVYMKLLITFMKEYDVIFVGFMAQMIVPVWKWKFRNRLLIVDFFISIYDTLVDDRKKIDGKNIFGKIIHMLDSITLKAADLVICDTKEHGKYFSEEFCVTKEKIATMYLEADSQIYYPKKIEKPDEYKNKYLVLYFGSILPVQGVDVVMDAIRQLKERKDIYFIIIGPIGDKIQKATTGNVTYIDWLPQEKLADYIAFSDLCLAGHFSATVNKAKRTIPGKAYIYHAMNKEMILGDSPANRELFGNLSQEFVRLGDAKALAEAIVRKERMALHE